MQNGKSRIKRVASAVIAGVMALQTVAPVISYDYFLLGTL